jgi:hypothetical protein
MEVDAFISSDSVFFLSVPPRRILDLLRELGLEFEEEVVWCG